MKHPDGTPKSTGNAFAWQTGKALKLARAEGDIQAKAKRVNPESNLGYGVKAQIRKMAQI